MTTITDITDGRLYIAGQRTAASTGQEFDVVDPGRGTPFAKVADASVEDGLAAVAAAYDAGPAWAAVPARERGEILRRAFNLMIERREDLARLISLENGKAYSEAVAEVNYAAEFLRWFSEEACRGTGALGSAPGGTGKILTTMSPVGVCVFVTPWNFPAAMATRKIGPALAAGCTTVLKPAKETPLTALAMADIFEAAGVPAGVVNVLPTTNSRKVIGSMLKDSRVRKISFTGSTEVGRVLLEQAAQNVLRSSMELGGNGPFIVLPDADLDVAVSSAMIAKLRNGGQSCTAANRFYVHSSIVDEFVDRFAAAMREAKVGYALDEGVTVGSMITAKAREDVLELVEQAVEAGGKIVIGGDAVDGDGYFMNPTLIRDVPADARCMTEEIFGPVAPIATFETVGEAVELANASEFGLVAFVHSTDLKQAFAVADRLETGMVGINRGIVSDPAAPFGGWKHSGLGREGGHEGLLEYLETKYIAASW